LGLELPEAWALAPSAAQQPLCRAGKAAPVALDPSGGLMVSSDGNSDGDGSLVGLNLADCSPRWRAPVDGRCLAFTPDGAQLLVGDWRGRLWLLDAGTGRTQRTWDLAGVLFGVAASRDGRHFAAVGSAGAWLLDVAGGAARALEVQGGGFFDVAFSPDSSRLVGAGAGLTIWDADSGRQLVHLPADARTLAAFFGPDGRTLYSFGHVARREVLVDDAATPPERQLAEVLARYRLKLVGQRVVEDEPAPLP
jgi:sugar lactone lactonase YvrE